MNVLHHGSQPEVQPPSPPRNPSPGDDLLDLIPPDRFEELYERLETEFGVPMFDGQSDEDVLAAENVHNAQSLFEYVSSRLEMHGKTPEPPPGETTNDLRRELAPRVRAILAESLGIDPLEVSEHAPFADYIPFVRRRRIFEHLAQTSGFGHVGGSTLGCWTLFLISTALSSWIAYILFTHGMILFGAVCAGLVSFIFIALITDRLLTGYTYHFPYETLDDFTTALANRLVEGAVFRQIARRVVTVVASMFDHDTDLKEEILGLLRAPEPQDAQAGCACGGQGHGGGHCGGSGGHGLSHGHSHGNCSCH